MSRTRIVPLSLLALVFSGVAVLASQSRDTTQAPEKEIRWRVAGSSDALEETTRVRIVLANELKPGQSSEKLGIVQTAAYLFSSPAPGFAHPLERSRSDGELAASTMDPDLLTPGSAPAPFTVSVEPPEIEPEDVAVGLVMGRPLRLVGLSGEDRRLLETKGTIAVAEVRLDPAELEERRRWAPETLVPPGKIRTVWEGAVPLATNRVYADYLVIRPARIDVSTPPADAGGVRDTSRTPEGGILDMPARSTSVGAPTVVSLGPALARPSQPRVFSIELRRGVLNEIRLRAYRDPVGTYRLEVELRRESLREDADANP